MLVTEVGAFQCGKEELGCEVRGWETQQFIGNGRAQLKRCFRGRRTRAGEPCCLGPSAGSGTHRPRDRE